MCGLAGIAGDVDARLKEAFLDLFLITQMRGRDASGAFSVSFRDDVNFMKTVGTPENLIDRRSFENRVLSGFPKVMAAHCRSKTVGENNTENAHPYAFENLIGMHNGTLRGHHQMEGYDHKATDSYALYYNIDKFGLEETMKGLDPSSHYALVWWDKVNSTLNFLRNEHRPLWFAWTKNKKAMIWASEPGMFWAVNRKVELWDGSPEKEGEEARSPYFQLPVNQLWSFSVEHIHNANKPSLTLHPVREIEAEGKKSGNGWKPAVSSAGSQWSRPNGRWIDGRYIATTEGGEVTSPFPKKGKEDSLDDPIPTFGKPEENRSPVLLLEDLARDRTQGGKTTTSDAGKTSETPSSKILDFRVGSRLSRNSQRNTLSLPPKISPTTGSSSNDDSCAGSKTSGSRPPRSKMSWRTLAGMFFIKDAQSDRELEWGKFLSEVGGDCSFCKKPLEIKEVFSVVEKGKAICMSCVTTPTYAEVAQEVKAVNL